MTELTLTAAPRRRWLAGFLIAALAVAACTGDTGTDATGGPTTGGPTTGGPTTDAPVATDPPSSDGCPTAQPDALPAGETRTVTIETDLGNIVIEVVGEYSPIAAGNFVALAECGFYDDVVFHRVVPGFVIQGGDGEFGVASSPGGQPGTGGPGYTIQDEPVTQTYARGTVAMARTAAPNSQGSQFFIVLDDEARGSLAAANTYAIFGSVTDGMATVDAIAAAADREIPTNPVVMNRVAVSQAPR